MLHEFLASNREELIRRCRSKVSRRASPPATSLKSEHGVRLFLEQLIDALRVEARPAAQDLQELDSLGKSPASLERTRTASLHGKRLLEMGYAVDQVVHEYGDICQALTELATEAQTPVTVEEFHTLNRLLDNAIADAVSAYGHCREEAIGSQEDHALHERLGTLADEQRRLLDTALKALDALKAGNIGLMGATGALLEDSLVRLRVLVDRSLPEIRLTTGMT